jgi:4-carboxymuconolactone decarboxylase
MAARTSDRSKFNSHLSIYLASESSLGSTTAVVTHDRHTMDSRFPTKEAPASAEYARQVITESLTTRYGWPPPFKWVADDGESLVGCYAPLCYSPNMIKKWFDLADVIVQEVKPRHRVLAITAMCSVLDAPYVTYCQRLVAPTVGFSEEQFNTCLAGNVPQSLTEDEEAVYTLGRTLSSLSGPLDRTLWQDAITKLGHDTLVSIANLISGYRWVSMLDQINGDDERWRQ